jgi:hypothetical protein
LEVLTLKVELVKEMCYERLSCGCGMAVFERDPTPELTEAVRKVAEEYSVGFKLVDAKVHPEVLRNYGIEELPAVIIEGKVYVPDVEVLKKALSSGNR